MAKNDLSLGSTLKNKHHAENDSRHASGMFHNKKKTSAMQKMTILRSRKNGHFAQAIVRKNYQKWPILGRRFQEKKSQGKCLQALIRNIPEKKTLKKSTKHAKLTTFHHGQNGSQKHLIIEKWQLFHHSQNWPQCKGYSLCKIVSLGQNLKFTKTC